MARQQIGAPALPVAENIIQHSLIGTTAQAAEKLSGRRRRSGARIEQGDFNFAGRKRVVDDRQVSDYHAEERKTHARLEDGQGAGDAVGGNYVTIAQGKKSLSAVIEHLAEGDSLAAQREMLSEPILHTGKAKDQAESPEAEQPDQGQWAIVGEKAFAPRWYLDMARDACPAGPGELVKEPGDAKVALDAAREDDRL